MKLKPKAATKSHLEGHDRKVSVILRNLPPRRRVQGFVDSDPRRRERDNIDQDNEAEDDEATRDRECWKLRQSKVDTDDNKRDQLVEAHEDTVRAHHPNSASFSKISRR